MSGNTKVLLKRVSFARHTPCSDTAASPAFSTSIQEAALPEAFSSVNTLWFCTSLSRRPESDADAVPPRCAQGLSSSSTPAAMIAAAMTSVTANSPGLNPSALPRRAFFFFVAMPYSSQIRRRDAPARQPYLSPVVPAGGRARQRGSNVQFIIARRCKINNPNRPFRRDGGKCLSLHEGNSLFSFHICILFSRSMCYNNNGDCC